MVNIFKNFVFTVLAFSLFSFVSVEANEAKIKEYVKELESMDKSQKAIMLRAYIKGQPHDLGYSMVVLAWKESRFGKYMLNLNDGKHGSYGVYHILLDYSMVRNNATSAWNKSRLAEKLINDFDFASEEALGLLKLWAKKYKSNKEYSKYYFMFAAYNGGYNALKSSQAKSYGEDAILRMAAVKRYFAKNDLIAKINEHNLILASR